MEVRINNYTITCNQPKTAHVDYPDCYRDNRFLGSKEFETIYIPKNTGYTHETIGKYRFSYFFVRCYRDDVESWLSLDQLRKIFYLPSVQETAEVLSGKTFTIKTEKRISTHNNVSCEVEYFSVINIK